jgi:hypothetical protein
MKTLQEEIKNLTNEQKKFKKEIKEWKDIYDI